ncbi:hypothetical protein KR054_007673 [Drosophila jambulina]|nr:hypothetical protein KR054_007673 [Drosophila jambulina]
MAERALAIDLVRGWGLEFDGSGDSKQFLGRIEEKAATFGIRLDHIAGAMKFLLKGNALHWWQACPTQMTDWIIFKTQLNLHFVADKRTGQHSYKRSLLWKEKTRKRACYSSHQNGGQLPTDGGTQEQEGVLDLCLEDSWEDLRVLLTNPNEETTDIPLAGHKSKSKDTPSEESREEDPAVPLTNPNEETTEIPLIIKEEAWVRQAQRRPGKSVCFRRSAEGKDYRIKINRKGKISICQMKPDQLRDDQTEQTPINGAQILTDGGTRLQEENNEIQPDKSCEENDGTPVENPSEETIEIPEVIQAEACWRQAQRRPGQEVCYNMSVDGKDYRIEISRSGNLRICQVRDKQTELPPMNGQQLLTDCGTRQKGDVLEPEMGCEEVQGVPLTNQSEETTDIPLIIQEEARLRAQKRGKQISFKRTVDGKVYRVKINRGGYISICQM